MRLTMLGTGNAVTTHCFNTCFVLEENGEYLLVDGGGGNGLMVQLRRAGIDWTRVRHVFLTHKHVDHLLGIVWLMRMYLQSMRMGSFEGEAFIYGHDEVLTLLLDFAHKLLPARDVALIGTRLHLVEVFDGETLRLIGHDVTFFDIQSTKTKLFGFALDLGEGRRLTCCGDEAITPVGKRYARNSDWLLHEAFCLYADRDVFRPYEKHHSTMRDACQTAEELGVRNLLIYHTEDSDLPHRKERYGAEGRACFSGNLVIPDDLEVIEL